MPAQRTRRQPYNGTQRKLVIAIDVGTTFSGVSYALFDPGNVPNIQAVTQFIGQREPKGDSKVPSIVCYDQDSGNVVAAGAETDPEVNPALFELDGPIRAEWFKLHLRPPHLAPEQEFELQKLRSFPKTKTPVQVFGDMLSYLFQSTKQYIKAAELWSWDSVGRNIYFILSHPNGWEGKQQSQMRRAAVKAGLVDESESSEHIIFVPEGEASLHFCLNKDPNLHNGYARDGIMVVDCGGGTIDVSSYSRESNGNFKEITAAECLFQGAVFVTRRAHDYFKQRLRNSRYGSKDEVEAMANAFDKVTKCAFNGPETPYYVKFGGFRDNDPQFDIRAGSIKIPGAQIASFFNPAIQAITRVINDQCKKSTVNIKTVFLVGGFARSNYLFSNLSGHFNPQGIAISRADATHLNKAVADGAVSYYLDHYVASRVAKYSYGIRSMTLFMPNDPEHARRKGTKFLDSDGKFYIPGVFSTILKKGTCVSEETEFKETFFAQYSPEQFRSWDREMTYLHCYRGSAAEPPGWVDMAPNDIGQVCAIRADMTRAKTFLKLQRNGDHKYYKFEHDVVLLFGLTELKAHITWNEDGVEKRQVIISYSPIVRSMCSCRPVEVRRI